MLKVTLMKSLLGRNVKHIETAHSLGLRRPGDTNMQPKNAATEGKIAQIAYLLKVEDLEESK